MNYKQHIWITTQFIGFHSWPEAPEEVPFLRDRHRHIFHVRVSIQTFSDRGIEFFIFKTDVDEIVYAMDKGKLGSCEQIAKDLHRVITNREEYRARAITIEVSEDKENGALLEFGPA